MREIVFVPPEGETIYNPESGYISKLLEEKGAEYWEAGSADASLTFNDDEGYMLSEIVIMVREQYGVFVQFGLAEDGTQFVLSKNSGSNDSITISLAGEPWTLPVDYFVDKGIAEKAIECFVKECSGNLPQGYNWVKFV